MKKLLIGSFSILAAPLLVILAIHSGEGAEEPNFIVIFLTVGVAIVGGVIAAILDAIPRFRSKPTWRLAWLSAAISAALTVTTAVIYTLSFYDKQPYGGDPMLLIAIPTLIFYTFLITAPVSYGTLRIIRGSIIGGGKPSSGECKHREA